MKQKGALKKKCKIEPMRLRNDPYIDEKLTSYAYLLANDRRPARWREYFGNDHRLCLEIGVGRGRFLQAMSTAHPDWNFVGIDLRKELLWETAKKLGHDCANVALLLHNAAYLAEIFQPGELDRIYLNFPDPWPKKRHHKRRLTHPRFLAVYRAVLGDAGDIYFRTDHRDMMTFTLSSMAAAGFVTVAVSDDLHASSYFDHITSNYEEKKRKLGPIYYAHFQCKGGAL